MTLTAVSLFAGVGGFDLALQRAGVDVVAAVEIDEAAQGVLADRFPGITVFNDVTEVTSDQLLAAGFVPGRGIITGGFPCQDLSVAGRRAGLAGGRSGLFWEIDRLLGELAPAWVLLENVPGLLSSHGGRDMGAVLGALGQRGHGFAYRVLDAQHFGVPQRRRRVFIVGHLGDHRGPVEVLLEPASGGGHLAPRREAGAVVAALTADGVGTCGADDNQAQAGHLLPVVAPALTARYGKGTDSDATDTLVVSVTGDRTHALTAEGHDASEDGTGRGTPIISFTSLPRRAVRRLTPVECERLQGFPDNWTLTSNGKTQSDSARYRQLGNAVAVPVVEWIAQGIVAAEAAHNPEMRAA